MNPTNPNQLTGKWLQMTVKNLAQRAIDGESGAKELLFSAIDSIVLGLEKGYIEDAFETWIDSYTKILVSGQSIDYKVQNGYLLEDHQESEE